MRGTIRLALAHSAAAANATAAAKATAQLQTMILNSRGAHVDASLHVRRQRMCLQVGIFLLCRFCERARVCVVVRALVLLNSVLCARTRAYVDQILVAQQCQVTPHRNACIHTTVWPLGN